VPPPLPYKVCARAPLRLDLAGGGSDVPFFAAGKGGAVVAAALGLSVHVEIHLGGRTIRLRAEDRERHVTLGSPAELTYDGILDPPKAALNMLPVTGGIEILTRSDAPPGAGLGERAALNVALLAALSSCRKETYDATELAEMAFQLEAGELRRPAGRADPYIAALGGVHHLAFSADAVAARDLGVDASRLAELGAHLAIVYQGRAYSAESASRRAMDAIAAEEPAVMDALAGLRDLAGPMAQALEAGDWRRAGDLFEDADRFHGVLDPIWSSPPTRALAEAARRAGAWGIKPAGPRAGASLAVLAPRERHAAVVEAAQSAGGVVLESTLAPRGVLVWREDLPET
jgi:D-glycero-alpha-D-manno-heptose-7-phosphate kinase